MSSQKLTQTQSGKAWEYALTQQCEILLNDAVAIVQNAELEKSANAYHLLSDSEQNKISKAAEMCIEFLSKQDAQLSTARFVEMQSDKAGQSGDVRDIVIKTEKNEIGISAKIRNDSLKHSRLSNKLDFGSVWYGNPCSDKYWAEIEPVFNALELNQYTYWRDIPNKHQQIYLPILHAFMDEVLDRASPSKMTHYLLGHHDFYKIIKDNSHLEIQSFNINGGLKWGRKIALPTYISDFYLKKNSNTTAILIMDEGWQLSFRLHSATSKIQNSLKFDVRLVGQPDKLSKHYI